MTLLRFLRLLGSLGLPPCVQAMTHILGVPGACVLLCIRGDTEKFRRLTIPVDHLRATRAMTSETTDANPPRVPRMSFGEAVSSWIVFRHLWETKTPWLSATYVGESSTRAALTFRSVCRAGGLASAR